MYTIKQISDDLGISRQAVHKKVQKLPAEMVHRGDKGELLLDEIGFFAIKNNCQSNVNQVDEIDKKPENDCNAMENASTDEKSRIEKSSTETALLTRVIDGLEREISFLHEQMAKKDEQISKLLEQNERLTTTVDTVASTVKGAQALHANDIMKIEAADQATSTTVKNEIETEPEATKGWRLFRRKK